MEGQEIAPSKLIIMPGAARATTTKRRFADLVIAGLIVALAIGGLVM